MKKYRMYPINIPHTIVFAITILILCILIFCDCASNTEPLVQSWPNIAQFNSVSKTNETFVIKIVDQEPYTYVIKNYPTFMIRKMGYRAYELEWYEKFSKKIPFHIEYTIYLEKEKFDPHGDTIPWETTDWYCVPKINKK